MTSIALASLAAAVIASGGAIAAPAGQFGGGGHWQGGGGPGGGQWRGGSVHPGWGSGWHGGWRPGWGWGPAWGWGPGWGWNASWGWGWGAPWGWGPGWGWGPSSSFTVVLPVTGGSSWTNAGVGWQDDTAFTFQQQPESAAPTVAANPPSYWFYCAEPAGYYPYVQTCSRPWIPVQPQGAPAAHGAPPAMPRQ